MNAPERTVCVVRVGGSLLDWPQLPDVLRHWLAEQPPILHVLMCGGGELTDVIRRLDRTFSLGEETSHWLCIDALSVSARLLAAMLPEIPLIDALQELPPRGKRRFNPRRFLLEQEPHSPGCVLPHSWSATSDSIAARVAEVLGAEVVLLKSAISRRHKAR